MAASDNTGGYQCEFIGAIPEDLKCKVCKHVIRNSKFLSCCGEHFCHDCIQPFSEARNQCPVCSEAGFAVNDKKQNRQILALEAHCIMKDRGCEWTGKLEGLEAHLDVDTGDCEYVDVECPNKCDQPVEKRNLPSHLTNSCPKREFTCQHCNFKATYEVVSNDHWPQCSFYPVPCPNACGIQAIERGDLEAHLLQCPLEEVECDFSHAGCNIKLSHQDMVRHMEENMQKHLGLMSAMSKNFEEKMKAIERLVKEKDDEFQIVLAKKEKQQKEHILENEAEIRELKQQLQQQKQQVEMLERYTGILIQMPNFSQYKYKLKNWCSQPIYTHTCGYKFCFRVNPYGVGEQVSVFFESLAGEYDSHLTWPAKCVITLELLNQHKNKHHLVMVAKFQWNKPGWKNRCERGCFNPIAHEELKYNSEQQTQYLANNRLLFRLTDIEVISQ